MRTYSITGPALGPSTVTKSVTLEGTTKVIGGCTAFHRPSIDNVFFGGINAQATGDVPMTSYIDLPDTVTVDAVPAGTTGTGSSTQATIYCTVLVGNIFSYSWHSYVEVAWTWGSRIPQEPPTERLAGRPLTRLFGKYGFILLLPREGIWCLLAGFVLGIGLAGGAVHWLAVALDNSTREFLRREGVSVR